MGIQVIGAGWSRTGTASLMQALEQLGMGPCYHFSKIEERDVPQWQAALDGEPRWDELFTGYHSAVDWPTAYFYRELAAHYPEAKVVLTAREAESWFDSASQTVFRVLDIDPARLDGSQRGWSAESAQGLARFMHAMWLDGVFKAPREQAPHRDREAVVRAFSKHIENVKESIAAERLLVFSVADGWEPLCKFLGVDVPDQPFPNMNERARFGRLSNRR